MDQITQLIEDEIERRVTERMNSALAKISQTYDISLRQLIRDIDTAEVWNGNVCHGVSKASKQKCKRGVKDGSGFCNCHKDQKPIPRAVNVIRTASPALQHTHTLPPMFLAGCPACERTKLIRLDI